MKDAWRTERKTDGSATTESRSRLEAGTSRSELLAHDLFRGRERLDVGRAREDAFRILQQRRGVLRQFDAVVVDAPQQRGDGDVEHREVVAEHVLVLQEDRRELGQAVADLRAGLLELLVVGLDAAATFEDVDVREQFLLE